MNLATVLILTVLAATASAQHTAQTSVAPELRECYTDPILADRNNLPPTTLPVLIDIIQQIEDNRNVNVDMRQLATMLLHNYRQDGLQHHAHDSGFNTLNVLPFSATHHSFHRHRLLLTRLIPNTQPQLANDTLSSALKCGLHHMLSTTIDARIRNDEAMCNQLSQYRAMRVPREAPSVDPSIRPDDVEIIDLSKMNSADKNGQMRDISDDDVEFNGVDGARLERQILTESQCPILGGVVHTTWGAISGGNLVAGIAAGTEPQRVSVSQLTKDQMPDENHLSVNSLYPATVSGDLAEATIIQGTERGSRSITVGAAGGWNSTHARRFHMLQSRRDLEMTDAEIRGGVDGLVLGSNMQSILNTFGQIRLSQLLDMYYSARNGVYDENIRACNRRDLATLYLDTDVLNRETLAFATALSTYLPVRGTMLDGLNPLVSSAVQNLQSYTNSNLNDVNCIATVTTAQDFRVRINLYLVLDASWSYEYVYPAISHLLDSIEIGKFGSSITILSAFDGSIFINTTFSLADFHAEYTIQRHRTLIAGVDLLNVLTSARSLLLNQVEIEQRTRYVGGNSTVLLFLLNAGNINVNDETWEEARAINDTLPDLRVLFATSTDQFNSLWNLVRDMHNDIRTISLSSSYVHLDTSMIPIINRVRSTGRRIINPNCGPTWTENISENMYFVDFIEPGYINYYTISPNYFFQHHNDRRVRIARTGAGVGNFVVCHSRVVEQPRQNSTETLGLDVDAVVCETITGAGNVELNIRNFCDAFWTINTCPPFYISVQSVVPPATALSAICTDNSCRFPYNIRYQVIIENFGCFSGCGSLTAQIGFILSSLLLLIRYN